MRPQITSSVRDLPREFWKRPVPGRNWALRMNVSKKIRGFDFESTTLDGKRNVPSTSQEGTE